MASRQLLSSFVLTCLLFFFASPSHSTARFSPAEEPAPPVNESQLKASPKHKPTLQIRPSEEPAPPVYESQQRVVPKPQPTSQISSAEEPAPPVYESQQRVAPKLQRISQISPAEEPAPLVYESQQRVGPKPQHTSQISLAEEQSPPVYESQKKVAQKVTMSLYYESLCPGSRDFIVTYLAPEINTDLITILNLRLVPWGNAILQPNNTITCQHGEDECYLNTIHALCINTWPDVNKHFDFINCIEKQSSHVPLEHGVEATWTVCADQLELPTQPIKDCYDSGLGTKLAVQCGNETDHLKPPHEYVPWVVVNDKPLGPDLINFVKYVCRAYKGKPVPEACTKRQQLQSVRQAGSANKGSWAHEKREHPA